MASELGIVALFTVTVIAIAVAILLYNERINKNPLNNPNFEPNPNLPPPAGARNVTESPDCRGEGCQPSNNSGGSS